MRMHARTSNMSVYRYRTGVSSCVLINCNPPRELDRVEGEKYSGHSQVQ